VAETSVVEEQDTAKFFLNRFGKQLDAFRALLRRLFMVNPRTAADQIYHSVIEV
jgi:hypothetical protein